MKSKPTIQQFVALIISLLLVLPAVLAPSHPVEIDFETGEIKDEIGADWGDPGTTPDSFWYGMERWWERTFEAKIDHTPERFAEMQTMLTTGDREAATRAGKEIRQTITFVQEQVEGAAQDLVFEQQERVFEYERYLQEMQELGAPADALTEIEDALTETEIIVGVREGEIKEEIVIEQGISYLEAEEQVERAEEERFGEEFQERISAEGLEQLQADLAEAQAGLATAAREGQELPHAEGLATILEEATEKVLQAEAAWEAGQTGRAYGLSTAAEHLIENADRFLDEEIDTEEEGVMGRVMELTEQIQARDEVRTQQLVQVFEKKNLLDDYPPEIQQQLIQAAKTNQLQWQRQEVEEKKRTELLAEGKSTTEIARVLMEDFAQEYEHIYGEKYFIPPVSEFPEVADEHWWLVAAEEAAERLKDAEGIVEGVTYTDPYTEYEYTFTEEGYEFKTPLGIEHEVTTPEVKEALQETENPFETGTEVVSKVVETPEGPVEYRYTATGYEVRLPDGTVEAKHYEVGKHELPGGGLIDVKPFGFDVVKEGGERKTYEYHPEYRNFVSTDGYIYMPPEGMAVHQEMKYDYGTGNFKFERPEGIWHYDPAARNWQEERAEVGRAVTYEGKTYTVTAEKGWTDEQGNPVPPPPGQPGSVTSGYVFGSGTGTYSPITQSFAPVGTTVVYEGKTYTVDSMLGWSAEGKAVPPPPGQPSSAVGSTGGFARVGTTAQVDGRNFIVDPVKGWMDVETGNAVPPPRGYTSSAVGMRIGEMGVGVERNYNFVEEGKAYYFPSGIDPKTIADKSLYEVKDARGYDPAFGTDFGGSGPGYSVYTSNTYGHIKDETTGSWRPATKEEAEQAQLAGKGGGENPTYSPSGFYGTAVRNYNYVEEGKAYYFPPGLDAGKINVEDKSQYVVGDPRGYDPAYNTYFGGTGQTGVSGTGTSGPGGGAGGSTSTSYGHVRDSATGQWRSATAEEAAKGGLDYSPPGGTGTSGYTGSYYSGSGASIGAGQPWAPGTAGYTSGYTAEGTTGTSYGHVYDSATSSWRQATAEEAAAGGAGYSAPGSTSGSAGATYGSWSSPEGGYAGGTYSGGSYSGGSYSGGSYGGDTGGSTGGSTSGDGGGSTGGSTSGDGGGSAGGDSGGSTGGDSGGSAPSGGVVGEASTPASAGEEHSVTRWFYKFFGIKN